MKNLIKCIYIRGEVHKKKTFDCTEDTNVSRIQYILCIFIEERENNETFIDYFYKLFFTFFSLFIILLDFFYI